MRSDGSRETLGEQLGEESKGQTGTTALVSAGSSLRGS